MLLRRIARRRATLSRSSFHWNELRRTSLFLTGLFMIRHIKDYAVAAINGTLASRGDTRFVRTVGIDHKQVIAGEGFRVLTGGVVELDSGLPL